MCTSFFFLHKRKKSTVNSYNLISNQFHANLSENIFEIQRNLNWSESARIKHTNVHDGMIIQLQAAIFPKCPNVSSSNCFYCRFYAFFIFDSNDTDVVYNYVTRDFITCSLALRYVSENRYVKCPAHFFRWNMFHSLSYEQNILTNKIAGKLVNIKKIKLFKCNGNESVQNSLVLQSRVHIMQQFFPSNKPTLSEVQIGKQIQCVDVCRTF